MLLELEGEKTGLCRFFFLFFIFFLLVLCLFVCGGGRISLILGLTFWNVSKK